MAKRNFFLCSLLSLAYGTSVFADVPAEPRIRCMDVFAAMRECKEGMVKADELEQKRKELTKVIEVEGKKLETAMTKYKTEASTLNDLARSKKEQEMGRLKRDYESLVQSSEEEMKLVMQHVTEALAKEVEEAVTEVAKNEKLDGVVDKVTGRFIYAAPNLDYTAKVVKSMNKNYDVKLAQNSKPLKAPATTVAQKSTSLATAAA